ncbi:MAG: polyamine aminopropyltransferase [Synergistaceae bacterium]|nr:polyamine aminopropyltransferase [Synergistaceae bacterium]
MLWFTESHTPNVNFSIRVSRHLHSEKSEYQQIDVFDSPEFGRFLSIDSVIMLTEKDEFIYHEMITHVPMAAVPGIKNVLVVGGGDGGTVRELTRYPAIEKIDMVDIDRRVIEVSREFLPFTSCKLDDPRVTLYFEDGVNFVSSKENEYDLIIVDSTDPISVGEGLFTASFYESCHKALKENGILVNQHESPYYEITAKAMRRAHKRIKEYFVPESCRVYQAFIPTYQSGHWLFGFAGKTAIDPLAFSDSEWNLLGLETKYYNTDLHRASFVLPNYVKKDLGY